jgi:branched-chain amino acid transport system ATP-binding protein
VTAPHGLPAAPGAGPSAGRAAEAEPLLELRDVHACYGTIEVLHGIDLVVPEGKVVALLGPNGAGKTTTLAVVCGLMEPTSGQVLMTGRNVTGVRAEELARRGVTTIPEGRGIFPNLTVKENLLMATYAGVDLAHVEAVAYDRFPRLGERRSQLAGTLSGGEQQMLAMARGLAVDPAVLILDELSMGLAPLVVEELYGVVAHIAESGTSILVVEQFARTVLGVADIAAVMVNGRIRAVGPPTEIEAELSAAYLGA